MAGPPTASVDDDLPVPIGSLVAGKYCVEKILGTGGMGIVAVGRHVRLQQKVAIKMLRPSALRDPEIRTRFGREALASSRLKGEHVARVIDVGETESGIPFMIMEYLEGSDLHAISRKRRTLPTAEVIDYVLQACEALAEAHRAGIVHRDLKPANLFVTKRTDGTPLLKVLDFGISKLVSSTLDNEALTKSEVIMGSPQFMSPEQLRSPRDVDARSDIWAIGVILYKLLSGELPFKGQTTAELCVGVLAQDPRPLEELCPNLPPEVFAVVARCLQKSADERFTTVAELAEALLPLASDDGRSSISRIVRVMRAPVTERPLSIPVPPLQNDVGATSVDEARPVEDDASASVKVALGASTIAAIRPRRAWPVVAAGLVAIAIGGAALFLFDARASKTLASSAHAAAPPAEVAIEAVAPSALAIAALTATAAPSGSATTAAAPPASASPSARFTLRGGAGAPRAPAGASTGAPKATPSIAAAPPPPPPAAPTPPPPGGLSEFGGRK